MSRLGGIWRKLNEPRESRGGFPAWGCPGDGCDGIFRSPQRANEHAWVVRAAGTHDAAAQRQFLRKRNRQARQLRRRGVTR